MVSWRFIKARLNPADGCPDSAVQIKPEQMQTIFVILTVKNFLLELSPSVLPLLFLLDISIVSIPNPICLTVAQGVPP